MPEYLTEDELERVIGLARKRRERDYVMWLLLFRHGMRVSELVGRRTKLHGSFDKRERAEERCRDFPTARIRESSRKASRGRRVAVFQVVTPEAVLSGGLSAPDIADGFIKICGLKGGNQANEELLDTGPDDILSERAAVEAYAAAHPTGRLFPLTRGQVYRLFRGYCRQAGIPKHKAHPHILRHTLGQHMRISGASLPEIQKRLRHATVSSTGVYTEVSTEEAGAAVRRMEERRKGTEVLPNQLDSLAGLTVEEVLRRVLRQVEQDRTRQPAKKAKVRGIDSGRARSAAGAGK